MPFKKNMRLSMDLLLDKMATAQEKLDLLLKEF